MAAYSIPSDTDELVKLSFFVDMGKAIVRARTIDETLREIMQKIGQIFTPLNWSILLKDPDTEDLTFTLVVGKNAEKLQGLKLPKGEGIAGWIADTGQPLIVEDVTEDTRFSPRVDHFTGFITQSIIGVPLMSGGKVFGVIELINKLNGEKFTPFDLKILTTIADFAAIAIEKSYYLGALKVMAETDSLTGVWNRGAFERQYLREIEMCRRYDQPLAMLMVDIDEFKEINDQHGHPAGDAVLKDLAANLTDCVRKVDRVFRYGGDEFVVLMPNTTKDQALGAKKRIRARLDYRNSLDPAVPYNISIGIHAVESGENEEVLTMLDTDLYRDKDRRLGRDFEKMERHIEDMLKEEWRKLKPKGRDRTRL
jgi:diguanylate cyclase (GGDEF)-like protein